MSADTKPNVTIVYPAEVDELIRQGKISPGSAGDSLIIEVGDGKRAEYEHGHIPGAIYLDTNTLERPPSWNILAAHELEPVLLAHGIRRCKTVILYGRRRIAVARAALVLMWAGVLDVRWLASGLAGWQAQGYAQEKGAHLPALSREFGGEIPAHPEYVTDIDGVRELRTKADGQLVCVRSWDEYTGKTSGYSYIQARGRIPGSLRGELPGTEAWRDEQCQTPELSQRLRQEIATRWRENALESGKKTVFYCGTGWRASEAFLWAMMMGWRQVSVYDGGWLEWSARANNPIESG